MEVLLDALHMAAVHSLEALLALLGTLPRDLQADFLPYIPAILTRLADLVDEGNPKHS